MDRAKSPSEPARFINAVKVAVRRTVHLLRERHPGETLAGYALLTDDGLGTLLYLAVTREVLHSSSDPDLLFTQTDWPYEDGIEAFDVADAELRRRAGEDAFEQHVDKAFSDLVQAIAELRTEDLFGCDVFLSVASTDPSEYLRRLEEAAIVGLNSPQIARARREFLNRWQQ